MQPTDPYDQIARWYDLEHDQFDDDIDLYRSFAEATGGPVLELGCGSGRLLVPLAEAGYAITGVDRSGVMLARCADALKATDAANQRRVTLVRGEMADAQLPVRDYHLAFIALGTFHHLARLDERRATLAHLWAHVSPGAMLVIDLAQQETRRLAQVAELGQVVHIDTWSDQESGEMLTHTLAARQGAEPATLTLTHWYENFRQGGPVTRTCVETTLALITRAEIALLLEATGWHVRRTYGDHDMGEWDDTSPRLIVVAQAAE